MFRRPAGKLLAVMGLTVLVCCLLLYEGNQLAGSNAAWKLSSYHRALGLSSQEQLGVVPTSYPGLGNKDGRTALPAPLEMTTSVWSNPVYAERRHLSQDVCSKLRGGGVARLTRWGNVSYCVVPKVGCTFWLNVFRFLHRDTGSQKYSSPFDIPRQITHYGPMKNMKYYSTNNSAAPRHLVKDMRFMFVREPYSRLWSAYVDKFLLIDYWRTEGRNINNLRKKSERNTCASDISFEEFVRYVVHRGGNDNGRHLNEHWKPIEHLCSPCLFQPHVIGKIESFSKDSNYILDRMNMTWILDSYDHEEHVHQEMDMLIVYNWQLLKGKPYVNCTNATDLASRLWTTFQINGYLPTEESFPLQKYPKGINMTQFQDLAHNAYRKRPQKSSKEWRNQRETMMLDAFKRVPADVLYQLKDIYMDDFELFGYDPEPENIFQGRRAELETIKRKKAERDAQNMTLKKSAVKPTFSTLNATKNKNIKGAVKANNASTAEKIKTVSAAQTNKTLNVAQNNKTGNKDSIKTASSNGTTR